MHLFKSYVGPGILARLSSPYTMASQQPESSAAPSHKVLSNQKSPYGIYLGLEGLLYHDFGAHVGTLMVLGPFEQI